MKTLKQFIFTLGLISFVLGITAIPLALGQTPPATTPATPDAKAQDQSGLLPLPDSASYGNLPAPAKGKAEQQFYDLIFGLVQNARYILGALAIGMIVYAGVRMVTAQGNEDVHTTQRRNLLWAIIGLALVGMSGEIVHIFQVSCDVKIAGQTCTAGGFLNGPNAIIRQSTIFNQRTQFLIIFIKYLIGSVAVIEIVRSGMRLITMGSSEEALGLDKKNLAYGLFGLLLIIISDTAISKVFYKIDPTRYPSVGGANPGFDAPQGIREIAGFTNLVVSIVSPIAVLMLLAAAIMYITAAGNEEKQTKAKRMIFAVVIGIIIMYGAFAIVSTFVGGSFQGGPGAITQPTGASIQTKSTPN